MALGVPGRVARTARVNLNAPVTRCGSMLVVSSASAAMYPGPMESTGKTCGDIYSPNPCPHKGKWGRGREGEGGAGLFDNVINESVSLETVVAMAATG